MKNDFSVCHSGGPTVGGDVDVGVFGEEDDAGQQSRAAFVCLWDDGMRHDHLFGQNRHADDKSHDRHGGMVRTWVFWLWQSASVILPVHIDDCPCADKWLLPNITQYFGSRYNLSVFSEKSYCGIILWHYTVGLYCGIILWDHTVGSYCGIMSEMVLILLLFWTGDVHVVPGKLPLDDATKDLLSTAVAVNSSYTSDVVAGEAGGVWEGRGNKTECALLHFVESALQRDFRAIRQAHPEDSFAKVFTFNSLRKSMSTVIRIDGGYRVFCKGAPEMVLAK